jgi:hypothetical protein
MASGAGLSNRGVLDNLETKLGSKYSWLNLGILVYNDIGGSKDHWISGRRVDVFHEHDKNVVVFYRSKQTIPKSFLRPQKDYIDITLDRRSSSSDDIYAFICSQAKSCHTFLSQKLSFHQLAVIKRYSGLFYNIRLGLKSYEHNGEYLTAIIFPF